MNLVPLEEVNAKCFAASPRPLRELQRWCRKRFLPAKKIGGKWFVDLDRLTDEPKKVQPYQDPDALARAIMDSVRQEARH